MIYRLDITVYVEADKVSDVDDEKIADAIMGTPQTVAMMVHLENEPIGEDASAIPSP